MILFIGDYIRLKNNFYGSDLAWLRVDDIEPYDICVLSNGARVCAAEQYISGIKTANEARGKDNAKANNNQH